jgi:hypothetical protein
MADTAPNAHSPTLWQRWCERCRRSHEHIARFWAGVLDLAYIAWILRAPIVVLLIGLLVLGLAPQAQDLIVDLAPAFWRVVSFLVLLAAWVGITVYASYLLLGTDQRLLRYAAELKESDAGRSKWLERFRLAAPSVLGTVPFVIVAMAVIRSRWNLPDIDDEEFLAAVKSSLVNFVIALSVVCAIFVVCCLWPPRFVGALLRHGDAAAQRIGSRLWPSFGVDAVGRDLANPSRHYLGPSLLVIAFVASAVIFFFGPNRTASWLPRALVIPVLLGGWLPLLTWLSALGRRIRAPLISGGLLTIAVLSAILGDNHSVRRIVTAEFAPNPRSAASGSIFASMTLNQAVQLWMTENKCDRNPRQCPRPIIIAGAGGASRAGFFTASVIGHLMDRAKQSVVEAKPPIDESTVRNRIFAISGVSGSAVGAVMTVAAMARAGPATRQPCVMRKPELWYGDEINNWRDCLEALTAGDFLTPVVLGLIFNDRISFAWWQDRAAVLEQSWEDRFASITGAKSDWQDSCPGDLRCAFTTLRPREGHWLPLLLLNGASTATGRRIISSVLDPNYSARECPTRAPSVSAVATQDRAIARNTYKQDVEPGKCLLFLESKQFHELLKLPNEPGFWAWIQIRLRWDYWSERLFDPSRFLDDVRLSTAAHNSARFPLISPPGAVRNREHQVIDRIVDGGYIENYGALTALELAQAIHAIQPELAPFVLTISNDPDADPDLNPLDAPDGAFLSDLFIPIEAILSARTGHGRLAVGQVEAVLDHLANAACRAQTAHVRVWPQFAAMNSDKKRSRPVSMSWWLSKPIQIHLHQQTEIGKNQNRNEVELWKVWDALLKPGGCQGRPSAPSAVEEQRAIQ